MTLFVGLLLVLYGATFWGTTYAVGAIHPLLGWLSSFLESLAWGMLFLLFFFHPSYGGGSCRVGRGGRQPC